MKPLALIAAGGEGKRLGSIGPKALVRCAGVPLLEWCLRAFAQSAALGNTSGLVVVAAHVDELAEFEAVAERARAAGLDVLVTPGGPSRSHSVAAALRAGTQAVGEGGPVLVHDAARIFITAELIDQIVAALTAAEAAVDGLIAARPVTDTIKRVDQALTVIETPPRDRLWAVQTPQLFRWQALARALGITQPVSDDQLAAATDDAALVEANGGRIDIFEWTQPNDKITTADDLASAERRLSESGA